MHWEEVFRGVRRSADVFTVSSADRVPGDASSVILVDLTRREFILKTDDDKTRQIVRSGVFDAFRLLHWLGAGNRPLDPALAPPTVRGPKRLLALAVAVAALGVAVLVFLGVIAVTLKVFEIGFAPITPVVDYVGGRLLGLLLLPEALPALALVILAIGLPLARKFRNPGQFVRGLIGVALALVLIWQVLPRLAAALRSQESRAQLEAPMLIGGLLVSAFLFTGGLWLLGDAINGSAKNGSAANESADDDRGE